MRHGSSHETSLNGADKPIAVVIIKEMVYRRKQIEVSSAEYHRIFL